MTTPTNTPMRTDMILEVPISKTWITGLESALCLLRNQHPEMKDAELVSLILSAGICSVIDNAMRRKNESRAVASMVPELPL